MRQGGQALIEFAIVMFVIVLLVAGGVEMAIGSANGFKVQSAPRAAIESASGFECSPGGSNFYLRFPDWVCRSEPDNLLDKTTPCDDPSEYRLASTMSCLSATLMAPRPAGTARDNSAFDFPQCDSLLCENPSNGLPADAVSTTDRVFYLFNPLPIDVTNCVPAGASAPKYRGCVSRIFDGVQKNPPETDVPGLPPLNRELYSLYELHCYDDSSPRREVACNADARQWLLRLPGKYDPESREMTVASVCVDRPAVGLSCPDAVSQPREAFESQHFLQSVPDDLSLAGMPGVRYAIDYFQDGSTPPVLAVRYRHLFYSWLGSRFNNDGEDGQLAADVLQELDLGLINADGVPVGGFGSEVTVQSGPAYFKVPWRTLSSGCRVETASDGGLRVVSCS